MLGGQPGEPGQGRDAAVAQELQRLLDLQLLDVLGQVAGGHALVDVLVAGEGAELLDPRLHVVAGDPLAGGDRVEVDLVDHVLVGLDHAVRHLDAEVALRLEHRDPELPLEHDLVLRRPDLGEVGAGVPGGQELGAVTFGTVISVLGQLCRCGAGCPRILSPRHRRTPHSRAAARSAPVPITASTRPPAVTRSSPRPCAVPAWMTCTPSIASAASMPVITSPLRRRLRVAGAGHHHGHGGAVAPDRRRHLGEGAGRGAEQERRRAASRAAPAAAGSPGRRSGR